MSNKFNKPRGTSDLYDKNLNCIKTIEQKIISLANKFGYSEIRTPMFENCDTFTRTVGETSDIVKKEFFNFLDKGGREIALRPENTAGVIRAVVENKLLYSMQLPIKFYYYGSMFRYERPQSGRLREFEQFGFEIIGANSIFYDVETIILCVEILKVLNISDYTLCINNLGGFLSREKWINELKNYFSKYKDELTDLSKERLEKNPTRILDDKIDGQKDFVKNAPKINNFLSEEEIKKHNSILQILDDLNIKYTKDDNLVRGLDYYTNMIFEFISKQDQTTIIGGGRYNKMVEEFSGVDQPCVGFAAGLNRLSLLLNNDDIINFDNIDIIFCILDNSLITQYLKLINDIRTNNFSCVVLYENDKIKKSFSLAEEKKVKYVLVVGNNELKNKTITIKNQIDNSQISISVDKIFDYIKK